MSTYFTTQAQTLYASSVHNIGPASHNVLSNKKAPWLGLIARVWWRRGPESNRASRICNPVHNRFVTAPYSVCLGKPAGLPTIYMKPPMKKDSIFKVLPFELEREKSLELSTSTLARLRSTN